MASQCVASAIIGFKLLDAAFLALRFRPKHIEQSTLCKHVVPILMERVCQGQYLFFDFYPRWQYLQLYPRTFSNFIPLKLCFFMMNPSTASNYVIKTWFDPEIPTKVLIPNTASLSLG